MTLSGVERGMPPTEELRCTNEDCEMDLFENHYTYDLPDDFEPLSDLVCPYCASGDYLELVEL
jgi:hypothetical protein